MYFPIKPRLTALLKTKKYRDMCQHEALRPHNPDLMTDVYDSPAWQRLMGPATYPNTRLGFQFCIDGIPAFSDGNRSVKPGTGSNVSLSPFERGKAENIMLFIVIPTDIKDPNVKKYYDFMATFELDDLFTNGNKSPCHVKKYNLTNVVFACCDAGIDGVKIKIFSTSMDTPGRSELMGMQSSLAYQGCPVCLHSWSPGAELGQTKCVCDGYRRFLPADSRVRENRVRHNGNYYEYRYLIVYKLYNNLHFAYSSNTTLESCI